jgi:hypothetical protein
MEAAVKNTALIAKAPQPSSLNLNGATVEMRPRRRAASDTNQ